MSNKTYALIVAGGSGHRMNSAIPKQFIQIHGKPLLMYTFEAFTQFDPDCEFVLVIPGSQIGYWRKLCEEFSFQIRHKIVEGGATRFHSVKNGLAQIEKEGIVFIHDGVRPLVSQKTIENCFITACEKGNALPVVSPSESIRQVTDKQNKAVTREHYYLVQTPQTFKVSSIKKAYNKSYTESFTDDASVLESDDVSINLVQGNRENIKITFPEDIAIATALLQK